MPGPRNFENFIDAYLAYANDSFTPEKFNLWSGLSAVAGALERKVWLPWSDTFSYFPNIYVLLVALPGVGKSTALNKSIGLLQDMDRTKGNLKLIPSQVTEAKFIELMGYSAPFEIGTRVYNQSAGYYWASEASNSLRNIYGDFTACLTDFYDCPPFWEKATLKDDKITLTNVCLNLIAGSTFDYLGKLVTTDNIMGGFASRLIYVVHRDKMIRNQQFQLGGSKKDEARKDYRVKLIQDLQQIHEMVGPFRATQEFGDAWEAWYPAYEEMRQSQKSEKMQSLLARANTNVMKLAMLFSACESNDRILKINHWDRAITLIEECGREIPMIFREAQAGDTSSQAGLNQAILKFMDKKTLPISQLKMHLLTSGFPAAKIDASLNYMMTNGGLKAVGDSALGLTVKLLLNPNDHV